MTFDHILRVARHACRLGSTGPLSTGESLAAALVLNRADWLKEMNYTISEAMHRADDTDSYTFVADVHQAAITIEDEIACGTLVPGSAQ